MAVKVRADETLPLLVKIVVSAAGVGTKLHCTQTLADALSALLGSILRNCHQATPGVEVFL